MRPVMRRRARRRTPTRPRRRLTVMHRQVADQRMYRRRRRLAPPEPPLLLTAQVACDPDAGEDVLWHIADHAPELRMWLIANPAASPALLEHVSQLGGPGVARGFEVLFDSMDDDSRPAGPGRRAPTS